MKYRVGWQNPGGDSHVRHFSPEGGVGNQSLDDAYRFFRYLVYEDGTALSVGLYDDEGKTIVQWDERSGEMRSPSHPDAGLIRKMPTEMSEPYDYDEDDNGDIYNDRTGFDGK